MDFYDGQKLCIGGAKRKDNANVFTLKATKKGEAFRMVDSDGNHSGPLGLLTLKSLIDDKSFRIL